MTKKFTIYSSLSEDSDKGIVYMRDKKLSGKRKVLKIINIKNNNAIFCEAIHIDNNFESQYDERKNTKILKNAQDPIVINSYLRNKLEIDNDSECDLEIIEPKNLINRRYFELKLLSSHPQSVVRITYWLSFISIFISISPSIFKFVVLAYNNIHVLIQQKADYISSIFGFIGSVIIFFYGLPPNVRKNGARYLMLEQTDVRGAKKYKIYKFMSYIGILFIALSFLLQLISN